MGCCSSRTGSEVAPLDQGGFSHHNQAGGGADHTKTAMMDTLCPRAQSVGGVKHKRWPSHGIARKAEKTLWSQVEKWAESEAPGDQAEKVLTDSSAVTHLIRRNSFMGQEEASEWGGVVREQHL